MYRSRTLNLYYFTKKYNEKQFFNNMYFYQYIIFMKLKELSNVLTDEKTDFN